MKLSLKTSEISLVSREKKLQVFNEKLTFQCQGGHKMISEISLILAKRVIHQRTKSKKHDLSIV